MGSLIRAFFKNSGVVALPGYSIFDTPWAGVKTTTGTFLQQQSSSYLSGGSYYNTTNAQNDARSTDHWLPTGTLKFATTYIAGTNYAIQTVKFGSTTVGTVDQYDGAGPTYNHYTEITGISQTAGVVTVQSIAATKNASSGGYILNDQTYAIVRTGA